MTVSRTFRSLRVVNFRWFAAASLITNIAMWMQRIAQDWLAVKVTGDGLAVGVTTALQFLPILLVGPFAGTLADRVSRRALLIAASIMMAVPSLLLGGVIAGGWVTIWHVYAFALLLGVGSAVDTPVRMAYVRDILSKDDLVNAIGLSQLNFHSSRVIGPMLAGFLIGATGIASTFIAVGAAYLAAIAVLFKIRVAAKPVAAPGQPAGPRPKLSEAIRQLRSQPGLIVLFALVAIVASFTLNFQITTTLMATKVFKLSAREFGELTSMMAIGSVVGALLVARLTKPSYFLVVASAGLLGLAYMAAVGAKTPIVFGLMLLPIGLLSNMYLATSGAMVQISTANRHQGRVSGLYMAASFALVPAGAVIIGFAADTWSPRAPLAVAGLMCLVGAVAAFAALRSLGVISLKSGRIADVEAPESAADPLLDAAK